MVIVLMAGFLAVLGLVSICYCPASEAKTVASSKMSHGRVGEWETPRDGAKKERIPQQKKSEVINVGSCQSAV